MKAAFQQTSPSGSTVRATSLRFAVWLILSATATAITGWFAPHKAVFVPGMFMAIMYPMVLMPWPRIRHAGSPCKLSQPDS